jgi:AraC-like DNA-binding protein
LEDARPDSGLASSFFNLIVGLERMSRYVNLNEYLIGVVEVLIVKIEKDLNGEMSVSQLSACSGYSEGHLRRVFKKATGTSMMKHMRINKLNHAAMELSSGRKVIDVALNYGYSSQQSFCRAFKEVFGVTPSKFISLESHWRSK